MKTVAIKDMPLPTIWELDPDDHIVLTVSNSHNRKYVMLGCGGNLRVGAIEPRRLWRLIHSLIHTERAVDDDAVLSIAIRVKGLRTEDE